MKANVDIPDDLMNEVSRRASLLGQKVEDQVVSLLRLAVAQNTSGNSMPSRSPVVRVDPATGLPTVQSPPDAMVRSMSASQVLGLCTSAMTEDDFERAGLSIRH